MSDLPDWAKAINTKIDLSVGGLIDNESVAQLMQSIVPRGSRNASECVFEIQLETRNFERSLSSDREIVAQIAAFSGSLIVVNEIVALDPHLVSLVGVTTDGDPVRIVQHYTQINLQLRAIRLRDPERPYRPIGFRVADDQAESK